MIGVKRELPWDFREYKSPITHDREALDVKHGTNWDS